MNARREDLCKGLALLLVALSQPYSRAAAVLVDEFNAGGS
jgi:hypothetical protein